MKRLLAFVVFAMLIAACGEQGVMDGLGERSHGYVAGPSTTAVGEVRVAATTAPGVTPVEGVLWFNERIENEYVGDSDYVVSGVWHRGNASGRFIQASPAEIDSALPGLDFPSVVPSETSWVTSQLVYDTASATLDVETAAAFGLWSVRPYTEDEGRLAVLRIGRVSESTGGEVGGGITSAVVEEGLNLVWSDGTYEYDLFCRQEVPEDLCWQMVESVVPLSIVAPEPATPS